MPRAEQREAGEPCGERQAENDQRRAVPSAGEHQPGAGAGPGAAGHAAGGGGAASSGEGDVGICTLCLYVFIGNYTNIHFAVDLSFVQGDVQSH